ncbi:MAG: diguanylate cyclase [Candidatus Hydrogenedentes bacterium]|nr:diguanylate cyclase [Candidatus Hydrogenedentota bacterium]
MTRAEPRDDASRRRVLISDCDLAVLSAARQALEKSGYSVLTANTPATALNLIFTNPIQCAVFNGDTPAEELRRQLSSIEQGNIFGRVPIILLLSPERAAAGVDWESIPADDYLVRPLNEAELLRRVRLCTARAMRDINANPLTGLPGNHTIMREAERRLAKGGHFAMAYLDLDNFKPFNDRYGFSRGDEVLRMTARVLVNALSLLGTQEVYLGHVGGDDFVFITPPELIAAACDSAIRDFDAIIRNFYDEADRAKGGIESVDRKGVEQKYPIMSCSIGVVDTQLGQIKHLADLSTRLAQMKFYAKKVPGSRYLIDRRM